MSVFRHVLVRGRVHGVGYRAFVEDEALRLGLEGWVRNRRDGTVEAVFSGDDHVVAKIVEACRRGPSAAFVGGVDVADGDAELLGARRPGERFSVLATV
jgi:acylphosphatase